MDDLISRKAAIKAVENLQDCYNGFSDTYDKACIIGVLEEVPTIDPKYSWIPCKKRMPKPNEKTVNSVRKYYLVQNEFGDMMVASYNVKGSVEWWEQMYKYEPITDEIVAWMPLPKPYKGDKNEAN